MNLEVKELLENLMKQYHLEDFTDLALDTDYDIYVGEYPHFCGITPGTEDVGSKHNFVIGVLTSLKPSDFAERVGYVNIHGFWFNNMFGELELIKWQDDTSYASMFSFKFASVNLKPPEMQRWRMHKNKIENYIDLAVATNLYVSK